MALAVVGVLMIPSVLRLVAWLRAVDVRVHVVHSIDGALAGHYTEDMCETAAVAGGNAIVEFQDREGESIQQEYVDDATESFVRTGTNGFGDALGTCSYEFEVVVPKVPREDEYGVLIASPATSFNDYSETDPVRVRFDDLAARGFELRLRWNADGLAVDGAAAPTPMPSPSTQPTPEATKLEGSAGDVDCPNPAPAIVDAERAAKCFYHAWQTGDRALAAVYGSTSATATLFDVEYEAPGAEWSGCFPGEEGQHATCSYYFPDPGAPHGVSLEFTMGGPSNKSYVDVVDFIG